MLLRQRPMEGRLRVPLVDRIHCSGFPDRADDGVRTRGFLLGKQACCRCTTSAWPGFPNGSDHIPSDRRSACFPAPGNQGLVARGGIRTHDLQVMGLAGYRTALPRMAALSRGRRTAGACSGRPARGRSRAAARRARICGPTVAAKHAMEESNLRGRFWRPSDCHCPNGVLCFPLFDCQTSPPASGVRPRAAACDGMRPRRGGHPLRRVASHGRARRRPARRPGACLSAGMPRTAMRPPTHPIRPARRAPATGRRRPCPEARTPRTAAPPRTPSFLRKP